MPATGIPLPGPGGPGGVSVPPGGNTGQRLTKLSNTDGDAGWVTPDVSQGDITALQASVAGAVGSVVYGSGSVPARPTGYGVVFWFGTSSPLANMAEGDVWIGP